jgi:cytochrome bd-type quinol oxidase subunit 2
MSYTKAARAWLGSVVTFAALLGAWFVAVQAFGTVNDDVLRVAARAAIGFAAIFAIAAVLVYIPTFSALEALSHRRLSRTRAIVLGVALALVPRLVVAWRFQESASPAAWLLYWARHLARFPIGILPFAIPGAVFGLLWSSNVHNECVAPSRRAV